MYKHSKRQKERDKLKDKWSEYEKQIKKDQVSSSEKKIIIDAKGLYVDEKV